MNTALRACVVAVASLGSAVPVWADKPDEKAKVKIEIRRAETKAADGLTEATVEGSKVKVYLHKTPDATNEHIAEARVGEDAQKNPAIEVVFTKEGAKRMAAMSEQHADKPVAILIDGKVISAPGGEGEVLRAHPDHRRVHQGRGREDRQGDHGQVIPSTPPEVACQTCNSAVFPNTLEYRARIGATWSAMNSSTC